MKTELSNRPQVSRSNIGRQMASMPERRQCVLQVLCQAVVLAALSASPMALQAEPSSPSQAQLMTVATNTNAVSFITNQVIVSRLAGSGTKGYAGGTGTNARFDGPNAGFVDRAGFVYVADWSNRRIRKVSPSGEVTTLGGTGLAGYADGPATNALFSNPVGICVDAAETVFVADAGNNRIRRINAAGLMETIAGTGVSGNVDGDGKTAQFLNPGGIGLGGEGLLYVVDSGNQVVRKVVWGTPVTPAVPTHYVLLESTNPTPPYSSWATAATNIQQAIGVAAPRSTIVVTNGVYRVGTAKANGDNRVALTNEVVVQSVNGPEVTVIEGLGWRCAYVGNGSVLSGFTLTKGNAAEGGGGVCCESSGVATNCVLKWRGGSWPLGPMEPFMSEGVLTSMRWMGTRGFRNGRLP